MLIICAGMLRAGSTLQYNLVAALLEKTGAGQRGGRLDTEEDWFANPSLIAWARDPSTCHVVKRGLVPLSGLQMFGGGVVRFVYIYRDIRDVAASAKEMWGLSGDQLHEFLDEVLGAYHNVQQLPSVLYQRYEDVTGDTRGAVLEIARFLELSPTEAMVQEIVRECSLEEMAPKGHSTALDVRRGVRRVLGRARRYLPTRLRNSWRLRQFVLTLLPAVERRTLIAPRHISSTRGASGAWRQKLTPDEREAITSRYRDWLIQTNYL